VPRRRRSSNLRLSTSIQRRDLHALCAQGLVPSKGLGLYCFSRHATNLGLRHRRNAWHDGHRAARCATRRSRFWSSTAPTAVRPAGPSSSHSAAPPRVHVTRIQVANPQARLDRKPPQVSQQGSWTSPLKQFDPKPLQPFDLMPICDSCESTPLDEQHQCLVQRCPEKVGTGSAAIAPAAESIG